MVMLIFVAYSTCCETFLEIETWKAIKMAMKEEFLPTNTFWMVREALRKLKHTSIVQEYVKTLVRYCSIRLGCLKRISCLTL